MRTYLLAVLLAACLYMIQGASIEVPSFLQQSASPKKDERGIKDVIQNMMNQNGGSQGGHGGGSHGGHGGGSHGGHGGKCPGMHGGGSHGGKGDGSHGGQGHGSHGGKGDGSQPGKPHEEHGGKKSQDAEVQTE